MTSNIANSPLDSLPLPMTNRPVHTPWGFSHDAIVHGNGIVSYHTDSHGGICLSAARFQAMPPALRNGADHLKSESGRAWFEEDCDWCIAVVAYPECFLPVQVEQAEKALREWHPEIWEAHNGRVLAASESYMKRRKAFLARHRDDLLAIAAWGDWAVNVPTGQVGVLAARGGRNGRDESFWLVGTAEYGAGRDGEFVIDPTRHERVTGPFGPTKRLG